MKTMNKTISNRLNILQAVFAAIALVMASCTQENNVLPDGDNNNGGHKRTIQLTAQLQNTRTGMVNNGNGYAAFYWHKGDAIGVQVKYHNGNYGFVKFTAVCETGSRTATFTGEIDDDCELQQYAVYPYNEAYSTTENSFSIPVSGEYNCYGYDGGVPDTIIFPITKDSVTTYPVRSTGMHMVGTITGNNIAFRHLGGLAVIRIDKMPYSDGQIEITADQNLCGIYTVSNLSASDAQIKIADASGGIAYSHFLFGGVKEGSPGVFFLPLATGTYTNLTITFLHGTAQGVVRYTIPYGELTINRAGIRAISLTTNSKGVLRNIRSLGNNRYLVNGRKFIDLGLESGLLWAETNIGATSPYLSGDYFAWGETTTKTSYTNDNAKWANTAYPQETLLPEDDAATANWGSGIRTATKEEFEELGSNSVTKRLWSNKYIDELQKRKIFFYICNRRDQSRCIYLPTGGIYDGIAISSNGADYYSAESDYWTSTASTTLINGMRTAYYLLGMGGSDLSATNKGRYELNSSPLYYGHNIRPVADK